MSSEKDEHLKCVEKLQELSKKHNALKDNVSSSLVPKVTSQKQELAKKHEELAALKQRETELGNAYMPFLGHMLATYLASLLYEGSSQLPALTKYKK